MDMMMLASLGLVVLVAVCRLVAVAFDWWMDG